MIRFAQISLVVLLAIVAAIGPAGPTIHKMACLDSGQVSYSVDFDFCCLDEAERGPIVVALCCEFDQVTFSVSDFDFQRVDLPDFHTFTQPAVAPHYGLVETDYIVQLAQLRAPPLPILQRLALLATFII